MARIVNKCCCPFLLKYPELPVETNGGFQNFKVLCASLTNTASNIPSPKEKHNCDVVGPPHPVSNLRPIHFFIPEKESPIEKEFRLKRLEVQNWNQDFWIKHNTSFVKERKEYMAAHQSEKSEEPLSAEEMSVFYKAFLDKNWKTHLNYNIEWYKKNAHLVLMHLRIKLFHLKNRLKP